VEVIVVRDGVVVWVVLLADDVSAIVEVIVVRDGVLAWFWGWEDDVGVMVAVIVVRIGVAVLDLWLPDDFGVMVEVTGTRVQLPTCVHPMPEMVWTSVIRTDDQPVVRLGVIVWPILLGDDSGASPTVKVIVVKDGAIVWVVVVLTDDVGMIVEVNVVKANFKCDQGVPDISETVVRKMALTTVVTVGDGGIVKGLPLRGPTASLLLSVKVAVVVTVVVPTCVTSLPSTVSTAE
jgi:hypothetical protein